MDLDHEILLLTDDVILEPTGAFDLLKWTFGYIIRAFRRGIGPAVFSALLEGSARAAKDLHRQSLKENT